MRGARLVTRLVPDRPSRAARADRDHAPTRRLPLKAVSLDEFAVRLEALGPFEPSPVLAVAVSGGADSTALALLALDWATARRGRVQALTVDHGLRPESAAEASLTAQRLDACGIRSRVLTVGGLPPGPGLAARARTARYAALEGACREDGIVHLMLGHHAGDQAETVAMRQGASSGQLGLAAMSAVRETSWVRVLRPLLDIDPARLRETCRARGMEWVDDPSNANPATLRARLRAKLAESGEGPAHAADARAWGFARVRREREVAEAIAAGVAFSPGGYAVVSSRFDADVLAAVLRTVAGRAWPPGSVATARLSASMRPCTLGGARILPAGRLSPGGWIVAREAAAMENAIPACDGAVWDGRFRLRGAVQGARLGALDAHAGRLRGRSRLPRAVLETLPALTIGEIVLAVPHLGLGQMPDLSEIVWAPRRQATGAPFAPAFR